MTKTRLITGAGRGMGVEFARAASAAGHNVVVTGRNPDTVASALGEHENLLVTALDVTDPHSAEAAAAAALDRFGRIDVLVNNPGSFLAGFFEELSTEQVRAQIETNLFGPMTVTRAVLPVMRRQRAGRVISISSGAGQTGSPSGSAYSASKFALEGWMESLTGEVESFGIRTMIGGRGRRRGRRGRGEAAARADRRAPRAVVQPGPRRRKGGRLMRGAVMHGPGEVRVDEREAPQIVEPADAITRVSAACVCGSDP